jgi:hypothetical protein
LLESEKTKQARIRLERVKLDHEWRMLTLMANSVLNLKPAAEEAEEAEHNLEEKNFTSNEEEKVITTMFSPMRAAAAPTAEQLRVEGLIEQFIEEHCIIGPRLTITSQDLQEGLLRASGESSKVLDSRRIGVIMHTQGFKAREMTRNLRRCRGFGGVALKAINEA